MSGERKARPRAASRASRFRVEVAYALPDRQVLLDLMVEAGTTVREAIECSGILLRFPGIELSAGRVGVFGRLVSFDAPLRDGDRVEIYRPLPADPREARRHRARRSSPQQKDG